MKVLVLRTDNPEAELGLFDGSNELAYLKWEAHRQLAETLHGKIDQLLSQNNTTLQNLGGIVVYQGPGSFTGLRIGISVANALAYSVGCPIVGTQGDWINHGLERLAAGESDTVVVPAYGAPIHITQQKK